MSDQQQPPKTGTARVLWELDYDEVETFFEAGDEQPRRGNVSTSGDEGKARDKAAEKVNADVSGRTLEKGKKVKDKAESDDEPGDRR